MLDDVETRPFRVAGQDSLPSCDFETLRDWCAEVWDVSLVDDPGRFRFGGWGLHMGPAVLAEARSTAVHHDRTLVHLSRGTIDHLQISLYLRGGCRIEHRGGSATAAAGDIVCHDLAQPGRTRVIEAEGGEPSHMLAMIVPRALLAPLLGHADGAHAAVIRGGTGYGRLLAEQFRTLQRQAGTMTMAESEVAVRSMAALFAGAIGPAAAIEAPPVRLTRHTMSRAIRRHIADHLDAPDLAAEALCRRFGVSRAALYRLFEPDGGLARFVQQQRLHRAFVMLTSSAYRHWRISDIGGRCGYGSDATFIRAFQKLFGTTPGEVRASAERGEWPVRHAGGAGPDHSWRAVMRWLDDLAYGAEGPRDETADREPGPAQREPVIGAPPIRLPATPRAGSPPVIDGGDSATPASRLIKAEFGPSREGFQALGDWATDQWSPSLAGEYSDFRVSLRALNMGAGVLVEWRSAPIQLYRSPAHIARSNLDFYRIVLNLGGDHLTASGSRENIPLREGDIGIFDAAVADDMTIVGAPTSGTAYRINLIVPRGRMAPLLRHPDSVHGSVIRGDSPLGRLMSEHFLSTWRNASVLTAGESDAAVRSLVTLVAGGIGGAKGAEGAIVRETRHAMLAAIKRHIESRLGDAALNGNSICRQFGLSRATLARLFEAEGGLAHFIQQRRLHRAFVMLGSTAHRHWRLIDIALECNFSSDATFIRAFRKLFELTPGDVRRMARSDVPVDSGSAPASGQSIVPWLRQLDRQAPAAAPLVSTRMPAVLRASAA